ncbi:YceI family protein [Fibrivirga algicola]|uniref:YceI family protein n=1 Tax=Fibrivirga algicola TaxID=2950420 RepID=A0ABX0QHR0_9BACT|nr:YceI family protein [Fibrivirga algicola]ARK10144.1 polyisoprenoid-binding protein [Fibrella sp. ES10-3-2-2]NID11408.1 YceI family protein [Fibrivirga algicola]
MKLLLLPVAALLSMSAAYAQTWAVDKSHSRVGFTVTHLLLSEVDGNFKTFDAKITSSKADLSDAVFEMTADINSVDTDNERRDGHLKSPDWFDAAKFPTLAFKSTSFKKVDGKKYKIMGDLTMHGVTKPITLDAVLTGPVTMEGRGGKQEKAGLKVNGVIKRTDFGVGSAGGATVSEEVELKAAGEFTKQAAATAEKK